MRIDRIELVSSFEPDETALLTYGAAIKALGEQFRGQVLALNVPDRAAQELPRLVIRFEDAILQVALNRFQFILQPPGHVRESYHDAMAYASDRSIPLLELLTRNPAYQHRWTGVVTELAIPLDLGTAKTASAASVPAFQRLVRLDWDPNSLVTFNLQAGHKRGDYYLNYTVFGYELRNLEVAVPAGTRRIRVDPSDAPVVEVGLNVLLDVNNKGATEHPDAVTDLKTTAREHLAAYQTLGTDLNLEGLI